MRIRNNVMSLNAFRHFGNTENNCMKSLEKLASGIRINRAGDDSAGLSISQKMRAQIRGLSMASRNTKDGISLLRTAEGALSETHGILQRMRELAVQASNCVLSGDEGLIAQAEIDRLNEEINGITDRTEFNGKKLLDGNYYGNFQIGANQGELHEICIAKMDTIGLKLLGGYKDGTISGVSGAASDVKVNMGTYIYGDLNNVKINTAGLRIKNEKYLFTDITGANNINNDGIGLSDAVGSAITKSAEISISVLEHPATSGAYIKYTGSGYSSGSDGEYFKLSIDNNAPIEFIVENTYIANVHNVLNEKINAALGTTGKEYATWNDDDYTITLSSLTTGADSKLEIIDNYIIGFTDKKNFPKGVYYGTDATYDITFSDGEHTYEYTVLEGTDVLQGQGEFAGLNINLNGPITSSTGGTIKIQEGTKYIYSGSVMVGDTAVNINNNGTGKIASGEYMGLQIDVTGLTAEAAHEGAFGITGRVPDEEAGLIVADPLMAVNAIQKIDEAINLVSAERIKLGAAENRLESTYINLEKYKENLIAAESRISDADMASEIMRQIKDNVLHNSSQAMLVHANSVPEMILNLLQ